MSVAAERTTTMTIRVPLSLRDQIGALAQAMGRNRQFVGLEALRRYVATESWQVAQILEGIRAAEASDFATDEEVEAVFSKYDARAS